MWAEVPRPIARPVHHSLFGPILASERTGRSGPRGQWCHKMKSAIWEIIFQKNRWTRTLMQNDCMRNGLLFRCDPVKLWSLHSEPRQTDAQNQPELGLGVGTWTHMERNGDDLGEGLGRCRTEHRPTSGHQCGLRSRRRTRCQGKKGPKESGEGQ